MTPIDACLAALAEPTRRAVVDLLRQRPHRAGELAEALSMSARALSRHLRVLRQSGLIVDEPKVHDYGAEYWADRSYGAIDPEGHVWWFTQRLRTGAS